MQIHPNDNTKKTLYFINRQTGKKEREIIYGEKALTFLYQTNAGNKFRLLVGNKPWFSQFHSVSKRTWFSRKSINLFAETYGVNIQEAEKPLAYYKTLDSFFTRRLKPGVRPVCKSNQTLASPADGRLLAYAIDSQLNLTIKGQKYTLAQLLGQSCIDPALAGGTAVVIRLAPKDYHRTHFPVSGFATSPCFIKGTLDSVHPLALDAGARSFENKRTVVNVQSPYCGKIAIIDVGALTVGTIVHTFKQGFVKKGDEKSYFRFGGSTVILLWGKDGPEIDGDIWNNSQQGLETLVNYGTAIGRMTTHHNAVKENTNNE